jgi:hypothetical protein
MCNAHTKAFRSNNNLCILYIYMNIDYTFFGLLKKHQINSMSPHLYYPPFYMQ